MISLITDCKRFRQIRTGDIKQNAGEEEVTP